MVIHLPGPTDDALDSERLTPKVIVYELDKYIVGQNAAKRAVAVALRNRWRRQQLAPELRDKIFQAYFSTKKGQGAGVGLYLAQQLVHAWGGTLTFESEVGRGTTFTLRLPAVTR